MSNFQIDLPLTTVVIPTLNEGAHIATTIHGILKDAPTCLLEIIVADGGSTDNTVAIVSEISCQDPRVRLIDNLLRIQAAGINAAVRDANPRSEVLVRMDAHSKYHSNFVGDVVSELVSRQVDSVVVRLETVGRGCFQKSVAAVSNSLSGTGGSRHRMSRSSGYVDHGHHAAIRFAKFVELGGYDESFVANEDAEFDYRLLKESGKIWFAADIIIQYFPRSAPKELALQYFRYGWGRCQNVMKHQQKLRLRQMLPPLLLIYLISISLALLLLPNMYILFMLIPFGLYCFVLAAGVFDAYRADRSRCSLAAVIILPLMHCAWGGGFLLKRIFPNVVRPVDIIALFKK